MPSTRPTKSSEYIRHTFTPDERLKMGDELAQAHNRMADIDDEESVIKSQFKERKASVEQTISKYSRELSNGFAMITVECRIEYDKPNVNEVSFIRVDTGEVVKTRPFTAAERQEDLPMDGTISIEAVPADQSSANMEAFFGKPEEETKPDPAEDIEAVRKDKRKKEQTEVEKATRKLVAI